MRYSEFAKELPAMYLTHQDGGMGIPLAIKCLSQLHNK